METVAVIDFETTGLSPAMGDRATEIAAVLVRDGKLVGRYQSLMNAGIRIPAFIQSLTGITDEMVRKAPPAGVVMREVADFVGDFPLIAHNASFDSKFWDAELQRIQRARRQEFACSMLVARRVFPQAPSHKLGELIRFTRLPVLGQFHRAQADAEMTAQLLLRMQDELCQRYRLPYVAHDLWRRIQQTPAAALAQCVSRYVADRDSCPVR
jgi:DNA polymerase-3 subunit epsilon